MSSKTRILALIAAWTASLCAPRLLRADGPAAPKIQKVIAIEEADSLYGKYRVVFSISEPMPAPRGAVGVPTFYLGNQRVTIPGDTRDSTTLFGYINEIPDANVMFKVISATPAAGMAARPPADEVAVDSRTLLAASQVSRGSYEAAHIRRSSGPVDIAQAWDSSESVFTGEFVRRDSDPRAPGTFRLYFKVADAVRGSPPQAGGALFISPSPSPMHELELGGRYLIFTKLSGPNRGTTMSAAVRLWWPQDDFVLSFLTGRAALPSGDSGALRDFLVRELTSNPAVEARLAAANELAPMKSSLTPEQVQSIRARAASEPSTAVKSALDRLVSAR